MEFVFIFCVGWVMSHAFGEKRDEYEHAQDAHREKYMSRLAQKHPHWSQARRARYLQNAARRNALGHFAYLLRHGWSSTFNDFVHGWDKAKAAHEEWKAAHPKDGKTPSRWETFKAGWRNNKATREAEKARAAAVEPTPQEQAKPVPSPRQPEPDSDAAKATQEADGDGEGAEVIRWPGQILIRGMGIDNTKPETPGNTAGSTNGSTTVEFTLDGAKTAIHEIGAYNASKLSLVEQVIADGIVGGLQADAETMNILGSLKEAMANVAALTNAFVDSTVKHAAGQEYANTGHAANTDYLKSN